MAGAARSRCALLLVFGSCGALVLPRLRGAGGRGRAPGAAFAASAASASADRRLRLGGRWSGSAGSGVPNNSVPKVDGAAEPQSEVGAAIVAGAALVGLIAASTLRSRVACRGLSSVYALNTTENLDELIPEDRDPLTLEYWQRDEKYGLLHLQASMREALKAGKKVFWEAQVIEVHPTGCFVDLVHSGFRGWMHKKQESPKGRPSVGDRLMVECQRCPAYKKVFPEGIITKYPLRPTGGKYRKPLPIFSHKAWLRNQACAELAKTIKKHDIIEGVVQGRNTRGLYVDLGPATGDNPIRPMGLLLRSDISRLKCSEDYMNRMFPDGCYIKVCVMQAEESGRITLATNVFEDDDHVGYMLNFPARVFKSAEQGLAKYLHKREAHIAWRQRDVHTEDEHVKLPLYQRAASTKYFEY